MDAAEKSKLIDIMEHMLPEDFVKEHPHVAITNDDGTIHFQGADYKHSMGNEISYSDTVRDIFRKRFLNDPWEGTIEERLLDGYLYCLTSDDLSLSKDELIKERAARKSIGDNRREVFVQTGKAGVLMFVEAGKKEGQDEAMISKMIWVEMIIDEVRLYVNIKNLKVKKDGNGSDKITSGEDTGKKPS